MARRVLDFTHPDRFIPGAVGVPGERTFFLQAREGRALASIALEKVQMAALAERLDELLDAVRAPVERESTVDAPGLEEPLVEVFRVGAMVLGWDAEHERVVIQATARRPEPPEGQAPADEQEGPDLLRVSIAPSDARSFVRGARALVAAGRPACPFCGEVLSDAAHFCQRTILN